MILNGFQNPPPIDPDAPTFPRSGTPMLVSLADFVQVPPFIPRAQVTEQPQASHMSIVAGRQAGPLNRPAAMPSPVSSVNMYGASPLMTPNVLEMVNEGTTVMPMPHEDSSAQTQPPNMSLPLPLCNLHHHKTYRYPDQQSVTGFFQCSK